MRIAVATTGLLLLTGCGAVIPPNASFNTPPPPMVTRSLAVNTQASVKTGEVLYSEVSSNLVPGAILDGDIDFDRLFGDIKFHPGDPLLAFSYNNTHYYCPKTDEPSDTGLSFNSFCFVDEKADGHLSKIQMFEFDRDAHGYGKAHRFLMTFTVAPAPAPYHAGPVPFDPMAVQSELVFDGVKDGYVVIEQRLHPQGQDDVPYRRKFFAPVPQQQPVALTIPLLPFDGVAMPAPFNEPAFQPLMLTLAITRADDRHVEYSVLKDWMPWRMPKGIQQRGEFTTIPTAPNPTS